MSLSKSASHRQFEDTGQSLNLAAMIDIFTVLLIFLILTFVSDEQALELASEADLPHASVELKGLPKIQVQILKEGEFLVDGEKVANLDLMLNVLRLKAAPQETILLVADHRLSFEKIDRAVAAMTRAGYTEFQFLTAKKEGQP